MGTEAFSSVTADRITNISSADDASAVLGIEGYADAGTVPTFTNNLSSSIDITLDSSEDIELDVEDDDTWELVPVTFGVGASASADVALRDGGNAGTDSDILITATNGEGFTLEATRNFKIPASSTVKEIKPTVTATGNSGRFEFELENQGTVTVTLTKIGVVETTNNTAVKVGGGGGDSIVTVSGSPATVNTIINIGVDREPFSNGVNLATDTPVSFEFDRFRTASNGNAKMKGDDVRIDVEFSDGSSTTLDLCDGNCSF
jgi:hypothetical protein